MMILRFFVNEEEMEEVWVQNMGRRDNLREHDADPEFVYQIHKPQLPPGGRYVYHKRSRGWMELASKVLQRCVEILVDEKDVKNGDRS